MSFCATVKDELCAFPLRDHRLMRAEAYGLLLFSRDFSVRSVAMQTEHAPTARRYAALLQAVCGVSPETRPPTAVGGLYGVSLPSPVDRVRALSAFSHADELVLRINRANLEDERLFPSFIRGAFLAGGFAADPGREYLLEFAAAHRQLSGDLSALLSEMGFALKPLTRKATYLLYVKDSAQIEDLLTLMGATNATLSLISTKIYKDLRNKANRVTNCETANISRAVDAAARQALAITRIEAAGLLPTLPEELQRTALLRREHPEMPLSELCALMGVTRSGMNHRLQKLCTMAEELEK